MLYRKGMEVAELFRRALWSGTLKQNAWIPADTAEGRDYCAALQLIRRWAKANHNAIHQATLEAARAEASDRFGNEHNFVFERDGLFFHAGGIDASELPSSYKRAESVVAQIDAYGLAEIEDYIDPYGCIMAGDVPPFWKDRRRNGRR